MSISPEPLQQPDKLKEEARSSAATEGAQEEVLGRRTLKGDLQAREGGSSTSRHCLCPQAAGTEEELLPGVDVLLEVFPTCSVEQAQWVLAKARGDLEEAVQMLVEGKEVGPQDWDSSNQVSSLWALALGPVHAAMAALHPGRGRGGDPIPPCPHCHWA